MDSQRDRMADVVPATFDRELNLVREAIEFVALGGAPRVVVGGLQLGETLLPAAARMAQEAGVTVAPLWNADEGGMDIAVERGRPMNGGSVPLLIVEDDESLRRIVSRHLRANGYDTHEAGSAEEAASTLDQGLRPAVVVLDLNLPGDTGWEFLRGPALTEAGSPPVVITSATTVSPKRLAEFHVAGYLPKPFPLDTLVATVERAIEKESSNRG